MNNPNNEKAKEVKRIDVLRALAAANSAFRDELKKYGYQMSGFDMERPYNYTIFIDNGPTEHITIVADITYKQKILIDRKGNKQ